MMNKTNLSLLVLFMLFAALAAGTAMKVWSMERKISSDGEKWACDQYVCDKVSGAEEWIQENCYPAMQGDQQAVMCSVVINGQKVLVPLENVRLENENKCVEARCIREVKARTVNYTVKIPEAQAQN